MATVLYTQYTFNHAYMYRICKTFLCKQTKYTYVLLKCLFADFTKTIITEVLNLCEAGLDVREEHPKLMSNPGPLTAKVKRPDKSEVVGAFMSRFGSHVEPVGRPEGSEDVVVPASLTKSQDKQRKRATVEEGEGSSQTKYSKK